MSLSELVRDLNPQESVLLLGAGASVPSGGKTGQALAQHLCDALSGGDIESDDLSEACSLLEARYGRPALVQALAEDLKELRPDGSLVALMSLDWARIYTTNYDQLVERALAQIGREVQIIRTNLDFAKLDSGKLELLKIHGCVTRDRGYGHSDSMILTEQDYSTYDTYREALFAKLQFDLHTKNVVIVGQSLKDRHLRDLVDRIASLRRSREPRTTSGFSSTLPTRGGCASFLDRNLRFASGSIAQFVEALEVSTSRAPGVVHVKKGAVLPRLLLNRTVDIEAALGAPSNASRLFSGGSASYSESKMALRSKGPSKRTF